MIYGICDVVFTTYLNEKTRIRMNDRNFAHLVAEFVERSKSPFDELNIFKFGGKTVAFKGFGLRRRNGRGYVATWGEM